MKMDSQQFLLNVSFTVATVVNYLQDNTQQHNENLLEIPDYTHTHWSVIDINTLY